MSAIFDKLVKKFNLADNQQCVSDELADTLYRISFQSELVEREAKAALRRFSKSKRTAFMHKRLCEFVHDKLKERLGNDAVYMIWLRLSDCKTEDQLNQIDRDLCAMYRREIMSDAALAVAENEREDRLEDREQRVTHRAMSIEYYHRQVKTMKQYDTLNKKNVYMHVNRRLSQAVLGMSPRALRAEKGATKRVSARDYMDSDQLGMLISGLVRARKSALISGGNEDDFIEHINHRADNLSGDCKEDNVHGDKMQPRLKASCAEVKRARQMVRSMLERADENARQIQEEEEEEAPEEEEVEEIRIIPDDHERYEHLKQCMVGSDDWIDIVDNNDIDMSEDEVTEMFNNAEPCDPNTEHGLLIRKDMSYNYTIRYME